MTDKSNSEHNLSDEQSDRWLDLMIQRATSGLSETEQQELDQLAPSIDNQHEIDRFEATAAAFDLSIASVEYEVMPTDVHDRLLISAGKLFGERSAPAPASPASKDSTAEFDSDFEKVELSLRKNSTSSVLWREAAAILVAAASLLLMLSGFNPFSKSDGVPVASAKQLMDQFIVSRPNDLVEIDWKPVHVPSAGGKVLWSDAKQEGYMVLSGLNVNDPTVEQYQLWIFDNDPAQATPTDGGVFDIKNADIDANGQAVIPIKPSVPIGRAVQFAVTIERPGGVYVSDRKRLPVLATVDDSD